MAYQFLIVDMSATSRALLKRTIRQSPLGKTAKFFEADSGEEAMDCLAHHRIDLAMVDLRLPDMDGTELIGRIIAEPDTRGIPVVVIATRPDPRKLDALQRRGVKGILRKPFTAEGFTNAIGLILEPTHV